MTTLDTKNLNVLTMMIIATVIKAAWLMRNAGFGIPSAVMEEIEYHEDRKLDKAQLLRLAACNYIDEGHHVVAI